MKKILKLIFFVIALISIGGFGDIRKLGADDQSVIDFSKVAGEYYFGDGLGVNNYMKFADDGTFNFEWKGCMGTYDENVGTYIIDQGVIVLTPKKLNIQEGFQGTPTRFLIVPWQERLYLVPEDKIMDFVNEINQGGEPRESAGLSNFYLRKGDENKKVSGFPSLPEQWRDYLLTKPVEGKVVKTQDGKVATVNIGGKDGIKTGMVLTVRSSEDFTQLKVISVEDESAKAEVMYEDGNIKVNDSVSTTFH